MSIVENACRLHILPEQTCAEHYQEDPDVSQMVDKVAEKIPPVATSSDYTVKLARPIATALNFSRQLTEKLGNPKRLDRNLWNRDPFIPILFDSPKQGAELLARSKNVRLIFESPAVQDCYFLMTMRRHEFEIMGGELDGEIVRQDVQQTVISFEDHAILTAAPSQHEAEHAIANEIVLFLAGLIPERLRQAELLRGELEHSEKLLKAQIHTLEQASRQHNAYDVPHEIQDKLEDGQQEAELFASKLSKLPENPNPTEYLELVRNVLLHPEKHLIIENISMHVQEYGIKVPKDKGKEIQFIELRSWGVPRMAVLFAAMGRETALQLWPDLGAQTKSV